MNTAIGTIAKELWPRVRPELDHDECMELLVPDDGMVDMDAGGWRIRVKHFRVGKDGKVVPASLRYACFEVSFYDRLAYKPHALAKFVMAELQRLVATLRSTGPLG